MCLMYIAVNVLILSPLNHHQPKYCCVTVRLACNMDVCIDRQIETFDSGELSASVYVKRVNVKLETDEMSPRST